MAAKRFICIVLVALCLMSFIFLYERRDEGMEASQNVNYEKVVAITFDDGPNPINTKTLLDGLRERGVKATFFLVGERIEGNEDLILRMYEDGHVIGNHSYSHSILTQMSKEAALEEIERTNTLIENITGERVKYIRPPCGCWDEEMLFEVDMTPVFWDVDPQDWCTSNVNVVVERVVNNVKDGDIILFHDIYESSVVAALEVIDRLTDMGYVFITVDEILVD